MSKIDWKGAVKRGAIKGVGLTFIVKNDKNTLWAVRILMFLLLFILAVVLWYKH